MSRHTAPSACVTMRPDATGAMVVVEVVTPAPARQGIREGAVFGVWLCQSERWAHDAAISLSATCEYVAQTGGDAEVCARITEIPGRLNAAESRAVRAMLEDGAE